MHKGRGDWIGLEYTRQSHIRVILIVTESSQRDEEIPSRGIDSQ